MVDDSEITAVIDGAPYRERKAAAMRAHATQIAVDGPFFALSNDLGQPIFAAEYYQLVHGVSGASAGEREGDLFAGVTGDGGDAGDGGDTGVAGDGAAGHGSGAGA